MKSIFKPLLAVAIAAVALQNAAAIGITLHCPQSSVHFAQVSNTINSSLVSRSSSSGNWTDHAYANVSDVHSRSYLSFVDSPSNFTFRQEYMFDSLASENVKFQQAGSYFRFTLSEAATYKVTGAFGVRVAEAVWTRTGYQQPQDTLVRTGLLDSSDNKYFQYKVAPEHSAYSEALNYILDSAPTDLLLGSLTGTLAAGEYLFSSYIMEIGFREASGAGWFQLELESLNTDPVPDAGSTLALLSAGLLGLAALRRRKA